MTPDEAVEFSVLGSDYWEVLSDGDGTVIAYWGYQKSSMISGECNCWLLSAPGMDQHPVAFGRWSVRMLRFLMRKFWCVRVLVDERHEVAIKWLTWLGFSTRCFRGGFIIMEVKGH